MSFDTPPKPVAKLLKRHDKLTHSHNKRVLSHAQRASGEWFINTLMIEGCDVPFRYKRKKRYRDLKGARVELTFYPTTESVGGIEMDVMNVVRLRRT